MTKMKGFFKGMKFISQIFVHKEHEMEIGYPTDVKHVAHIGWDNAASANSPSWMNEFKAASDFSSTSLSNFEQAKASSWTPKETTFPFLEGRLRSSPKSRALDIDQPKDIRSSSGDFTEIVSSDKSKTSSKKVKKKKIKSSSPIAASTFSPKPEQTQGPHRRILSGDTMEWWTRFK